MSAAPPSLLAQPRLLFLFGATFLAYANIAVFFQFYSFLNTLGTDPAHFGLLIGAFSAVSLVVRPIISPLFHPGNARRWLYAGTLLVIVSLAGYSLAAGFWSLLAVRILHGLAFVVLGTAMMTVTIEYVPPDRSGQFFGMLAVVILIPNTLIPPLLPSLMAATGSFPRTLLLFAALSLLVFPLIHAAGGGDGDGDGAPRRTTGRLTRAEVARDLKNPAVLLILGAMLTLYCGHALVFFFLDGYGRSLGIGATGFFLTLSTAAEIGVRLVAGSFFDRVHKGRLAVATLAGLAAGYLALAFAPGPGVFFALGFVLGLGWGVAMPVFNGLMFDISEPRFRAFNTNLGLQMFQAGFFLGPFVGAPLVARWGFGALFVFCGALSLCGAGMVLFLRTPEVE